MMIERANSKGPGENRGLAAARNTAFREAKSGYLGAIDTDAVPEPDSTLSGLLNVFMIVLRIYTLTSCC